MSFGGVAYAQDDDDINLDGPSERIPTGGNPSPLYGAQPFTQRLFIFEEFGTQPVPTAAACSNCMPMPAATSCTAGPNPTALDAFMRQRLYPLPTRTQNETVGSNYWARLIGTCVRPLTTSYMDGRPPGEWFAHQRWAEFRPTVYFQSATSGARVNYGMRDAYQRHGFRNGEFASGGLYYQGGTNRNVQVRFHPSFPIQTAASVWTFDGTMPPKLLQARYGESVLFRHYNALPVNPAANNGFGANTITTHHHNGHNPAESDGFGAAFYFPGQYYDYRWPMILAGYDSVNTAATDNRAGSPNGSGGVTRVRGDWRETMSTMWFHDHMVDYTAQNVYKGMAAMMNLYSAVDRGREGLNCHYSDPNNPNNVNLCLPSGTALDWGNRDYDVNLLIADKAWDSRGQLWFNIFETDGFLGDQVLVNWAWRPYLDVRARRYRFRMLNGSVSRHYKWAFVTSTNQRVPFYMVANDGNIMEHAVYFANGELPEQGVAERYDIVIDFSQFAPGTRIRMVNLLEHDRPHRPNRVVPLQEFLTDYDRDDPAVTAVMEFRVAAYTGVDRSMNPAQYVEGGLTMIPVPRPTPEQLANARRRQFDFGRSNNTDETPWTIRTDGGQGFGTDFHRVSAAPTREQWEIWTLSSGGGWGHPVHIHFEEGQILTRDGAPPPAWERYARKDVYRIGDGPDTTHDLEVLIRFREFVGTYMEHCHNTMHEDHSMLLRFDVRNPGETISIPTPINTWEGAYYEPSEDLPGAFFAGSGGGGSN
ncbi:MAG: multicopper oxidase family protein [Hyphomonadaceae bacterium]